MRALKTAVFRLCLLVPLLAAFPLFGLESYLQEAEIRSLEKASAPRYLGDQVLLTYQADRPVRLVAARFEHERWRELHLYTRNPEGVYFLLLQVPPEVAQLRYRIDVDGLWMSDPGNPERSVDEFGTAFSVFSLAGRPAPPLRSPQLESDGSVTFVFRYPPGRRVYLVGDFNLWDPFWDRMREAEPGLYRLNLRLLPGLHYYAFSVEGRRIVDPLNLDSARDPQDNLVSVVKVPPARVADAATDPPQSSLYQIRLRY